MKRRVAVILTMLGCVLGCHEGRPAAPTPIPLPPPPPPPVVAKVSGSMNVTTALTETGGYKYTVEIQLVEAGGVSATIASVDLAPTDAWGPNPPIATFGPEVWIGGNVIPAHGTLTSRPLVALEEVISDYPRPLSAVITIADPTSSRNRTIALMDPAQRWPEPPPGARFSLSGTVADTANRALPDVTVEISDGANAGRTSTSDENGTFRLTDLRPGTFFVSFSRTGYRSTSTSVELKSNLSMRYGLEKE